MSIRAAYSIGVVLTGSALFLVVVLLLFSGRQAAVHAPLHIARTPVEELEKDLSEVEAFIAASQVCQPPCSRRQRAALVRSRSMRLTGALRSPCSGQRSRRS